MRWPVLVLYCSRFQTDLPPFSRKEPEEGKAAMLLVVTCSKDLASCIERCVLLLVLGWAPFYV